MGWALATAISEAGKLWHAEGVHPGDKFQEWVRDKVLGANGVSCTQDLWPKLSKGLADDLALRRDRHDRGARGARVGVGALLRPGRRHRSPPAHATAWPL